MSTTITTTTAPSFRNLPLELRLKIWSYLLPGPRTLPIRYSRVNKSYFTPIPPSVLLHISFETRTLFLEHYVLLHLNPSYNSTIYINFSLDTLRFDDEECSPIEDLALDFQNCAQNSLIQQVEFDVHVFEILRLFRNDALSEIKYFRGLRNVTLLVRPYEEVPGGYGEGFQSRRLARNREFPNGRTLPQAHATTRKRIIQCGSLLLILRTRVEHGDGEWIKGKPTAHIRIIGREFIKI